jgi:hypothetical protein
VLVGEGLQLETEAAEISEQKALEHHWIDPRLSRRSPDFFTLFLMVPPPPVLQIVLPRKPPRRAV